MFLCHVDFHVVVWSPNFGHPKISAPAWDAGEDGFPSDQDIRNFVAKWQWGLPRGWVASSVEKHVLAKRRNDRKIGFAKHLLKMEGCVFSFSYVVSFVKEGKWTVARVFFWMDFQLLGVLEFPCHNNRMCSTTTAAGTCNPSRFQENTYTYLKGLPGPVLQVRATWKGKKKHHILISTPIRWAPTIVMNGVIKL